MNPEFLLENLMQNLESGRSMREWTEFMVREYPELVDSIDEALDMFYNGGIV